MNNTYALVTAVHRDRFELLYNGETIFARLRPTSYFGGNELFPTVGDEVEIKYVPNGDSIINSTAPRRSFFLRTDPDPGRGVQAVAANFDYVFILTSMNHDFNPHRLERYLSAAWQSGGTPVILLTKLDLCADPAPFIAEAAAAAAGCDVLALSAHTGEGLDTLIPFIANGSTAVLLGSSGVGKSSLINALLGREVMRTGDIREDDSHGRHTTTHRQMIFLPDGGRLIDTPGMRALGLADSGGLSASFADIDELIQRCRFSDCSHKSEPGCAVQAALADGSLTADRWERYNALLREAKYSEDREAYKRERTEKYKTIAKNTRLGKTKRKM